MRLEYAIIDELGILWPNATKAVVLSERRVLDRVGRGICVPSDP